jgi:NADH-quinone oxidoreductase subunit M
VLVLWMGIYPSTFLDMMHVSVDNLVNRLDIARAGLEAVNVAGY